MKRQVPPVAVDAEPAAVEEAEEEEPVTDAPAAKRRKPSQLSSKSLAAASEEHQRRGLCYLSRLPPFMKPAKLRHLLSQHGEVLRIYLAAEDAAARTRRKRAGGNSGKKFHEGWVEFADKKVARRVAESLNGSQMGGRKRDAFYYDLWTLKYLPKFKWEHLTEELAYQKAVREQRLALELSAGKRERDFYLKQVDTAKGLAAMNEKQARRAAAAAAAAAEGGGEGEQAAPAPQRKPKVNRTFQQRPVREKAKAPRISNSTLASIFGQGGGEE